MLRRLITVFMIVVIGFGPAVAVLDYASTEAYAQKRDNRSFFQRLFGGRVIDGPPPSLKVPKIRKTKKKSKKNRRVREEERPAIAAVEAQPKDPNARKVLVVGDFVAGGVAWGLEQAFADEPRLVVIDKSDANSGLIRNDRYDWNAKLPEILNETQPDLVVALFGVNDRQQLRDGKTRIPVRSPAWETTYTGRVSGIADTLKLYGRQFFWVGAPPTRATSASADMVYFNGLYKPRVTAAGGHFVDIWNGFANEDGNYVTSGPDVEGQVRQLRTGDGINFTRAGRMKLAFYVEREIRRQTGFGSGGVDLLATVTQGNQIEILPDGTKLLVGPVISLNNPLPGRGNELAGGTAESGATQDSLQFKMIVRGESLPSVAGRADDFSWPPRHVEARLPATVPEPVASATPVPVARPEGVAN